MVLAADEQRLVFSRIEVKKFNLRFIRLENIISQSDSLLCFMRNCSGLSLILEGISTLDSEKTKSVLILQFLARVTEGKHLDVQFETDECLTPLEAAAVVLDQIIEEENDLKILQDEIKTLVKIQAVVVCMEKGKFKLSSEVLDRLFEESETNKYLRMKLSMVVRQKDPYHEFLENFSYTKMLQKIKSYNSLTLSRKPPVFLLQAATKMVEAKEVVKMKENEGHKAPNTISSQKENISTSECEDMSEVNSSSYINSCINFENLKSEVVHVTFTDLRGNCFL
ncbi:Telomeric repeat-binding factor 1 [Pristimantis euphronides]